MSAELDVVGLGRMGYDEALQLQRAAANARIDGRLRRDLLFLVEHPPVITLGRGFKGETMTTPVDQLRRRGIDVFEIERGGDITFHGPGQIVGYPIFDLHEHRPDLHHFLRRLEEVIIRAVGEFGIDAERRDGLTGVWTKGRKLASIGLHVKKWVTWHGFAINVTTDLTFFDLIIPCGIEGVQMTSLQRELGENAPRDLWGRALDQVVASTCDVFDQRPQATNLDDLLPLIGMDRNRVSDSPAH